MPASQNQTEEREVLSVSELNKRVRGLIESQFLQVWIEGEISNFAAPSSGHWYFTLKDQRAQVRCAMFAGRNRMLRFRPQNGMQVVLRGKASLYEGRGEFQLIADNLIEAGEGRLQQKFEQLKKRLAEEGLFSQDRKQALPTHPAHVGVITSPTGAAIRDILTVFNRRFPSIPITIIPAPVQGKQAAPKIVDALQQAQILPKDQPPLDVIILSRGGGSLEDLWPFNEETVARAIVDCPIPIVSAVGHEIDFTIADFASDARAATPSAAAEMLSPDQQQWQKLLRQFQQSIATTMTRKITVGTRDLASLKARLRHPGRQIQDRAQRLDELDYRLQSAITNLLTLRRSRLATATAELYQYHPGQRIRSLNENNAQFKQRLERAIAALLATRTQKIQALSGALHALSPLNTISRGYAIVKDDSGALIKSVSSVKSGDQISTHLSDGTLRCNITEVLSE